MKIKKIYSDSLGKVTPVFSKIEKDTKKVFNKEAIDIINNNTNIHTLLKYT